LLFLLNIQPEAVQVTVHNPLTMSTAKNVIILVTILHLEMQVTENLAIKLFADFAAGLVEVSVPATIETQSKVAAQCKIKPMAFGSCMCLNSKKTLWIVKCMAVYPFAGVSISEIESQNVDLQWPLEDLIRSVFLMLESLAATDPLARTHMCFYHGDSNVDNFLIDVQRRSITMIDFGNSYFEWISDDNGNDESCHFITPKSHFRNYNCEAELKTLYCVLRRLLKLHNSKWNANLPLHQALISFVSSCCSLTAQSERHRFQKCFESYL